MATATTTSVPQHLQSLFPPFCHACGDRLPLLTARAVACPSCGHDLIAAPEADTAAQRRGHSDAKVAALLSFLVPGAGQVFNGHFLKGFLVFATCWLVVPWVFGVIDAYRSARKAESTPGAPRIL